MLENNNKSIIHRITKRTMNSDKRRNFFIITAIVLTTFMITSVLSVGISFHQTLMVTPLRMEGMKTHAGLLNVDKNQLEKIKSLDYVKHISIAHPVGVGFPPGFETSEIPILSLTEESFKHFQAPAFADIIGRFAIREDEIMLSRAHLLAMGIEEPYIGMDIPMEVDIAGISKEINFTLSLIYTEYVSSGPGNAFTPLFVSENFAKHHDLLNYENMIINVIFPRQNRVVEFAIRMAEDLNIEYGTDIRVHPSLEYQTETGAGGMSLAFGIIIVFFMFVGFLLIYNVMYISVSKDVRFYGLLKSLGTTPKQLRRIVNGQVLIMYVMGMPIGLVLAYIISFVAVPAMINVRTGSIISFSPLIFVGGAFFTLLTVYLGASVSAKKAARVSPIEAIRYTGEQKINFKPRSSAKGRPARMAWRNIFRERKRAFIVMISLFLGIAVFIGVMAVVNSMDIDKGISSWYDYDINIANVNVNMGDFGLIGMDRDFIDKISSLPGISEISEQTSGTAAFEYPQEITETLIEFRGFTSNFLGIIGIDRVYMEKINKKLDNPIDIEAFERGEIILIEESGIKIIVGDKLYTSFPIGLELNFTLGFESVIPVTAEIVGYTEIYNLIGYEVNTGGAMDIIMSNSFLESIGGKAGVNNLGINIEKGMDEQVNKVVSELVKERGMVMSSSLEAHKAIEEARFSMIVLGSVISGILALIGIFNFINLISVGLISRKRELAIIESVGMGKKQIRRMLRWEGTIYWLLVLSAGATLGTWFAFGLYKLVNNQDPYFFTHFTYPVLPVVFVYIIIITICTLVPGICYRSISKNSLVERLREVD